MAQIFKKFHKIKTAWIYIKVLICIEKVHLRSLNRYFQSRYYDPTIGRFLSKDPIGLNGGDTNLYRYVGNNPINYTDPLGLKIDGPIHTQSEFVSQLNSQQGREISNGGFADSSLRFLYTDQGVVDMRHVQASFETTRGMIDSGVPASLAGAAAYSLGVGVEVAQGLGLAGASYSQGNTSSFSHEDIPSNSFGIGGAKKYSNLNSFIGSLPERRMCGGN